MFGGRPLSTVLRSVFQRRHYVTLWNMYRNCPAFAENLGRYPLGRGEYTYEIQVKTPTGVASITPYSHHDLLTVNEIFWRQDYYADDELKVVVDLGSNIGISALYFMTRNDESRCYLFEPDPRNVEKLKLNLSGYEQRYVLRQEAVSDVGGSFQFGIESTGRYGGIGLETGGYTEVDCLPVNEALQEIVGEGGTIDILKLDTEGAELRIVWAVEEELLTRINKIYLESDPGERLHPAMFEQHQYGSICRLTNKIPCA